MPELPEVETVRRGLAPVMVGRRILAAEARRPDLRFPLPARFAARLKGARAESLDRRGKHLLCALGSGEVLVMHLGMTGRFTIEAASGPVAAGPTNPVHDHVVFNLEGGARITFNDPRRFGSMDLIARDLLETTPPFDAMGPEPLSDAFDGAALRRALAGRQTPIKAALLDQRTVAGLGNIYVCEALHRAGVSPRRSARTLGVERAQRLVDAIKAVLEDAIAAGGSSLRDYAQADGSLGYFQHAFAVYDRAGEPCARPGCAGVVKRLGQSGRSTFYCGACQR